MFRSAAVRLTLWYLLIVITLSFGTSFALYHVSSNKLEENARRQIGYFRGLLGTESASEFANLRQKQLEEDRSRLRVNLALFNLLVLAGGGAASYGLARRTLRPIEEALEAQKRFTADASHELRTPLAAMQAENEVALRDGSKLTKVQAVELLKSNIEEVAKLKILADGLLTLSHTNGQDFIDTFVSAEDIISQAKKRIDKTAQLKKIKITIPAKNDVKVKGDQQRLADAVAILLDNAVKYSPVGSRVKVDVAKPTRRVVAISVSDKGYGIEKSELPRIFERFYRSDSSRSKAHVEGYGLGLAIAKKIADQHHGAIEVRSTLDKGSTFTLKLPA